MVTRAWHDEGFKRRLVAEPQVVLQEHDLPVPDGKTVRVVENTADMFYLALPAKPAEGELSDEQLSQVTGGMVGLLIFGGALLVGLPLAEIWGE